MIDNRPVYLDYHATTPVDPHVVSAMVPWFTERFGNAASRQYRYGWEALAAVDQAREQVASLIAADPKEIVFTSGATESNNLALKGVAEAYREKGSHFVALATEHKSVLDTLKRLEHDGYDVSYLPVKSDGLADLNCVRDAVTANTIALSVMAANNEIGVIQQLSELAAIAHEKGALLHTDAVQAAGKVPFDVNQLGWCVVCASAPAPCLGYAAARWRRSRERHAFGHAQRAGHRRIWRGRGFGGRGAERGKHATQAAA
jgi:cysteine desulfurase